MGEFLFGLLNGYGLRRGMTIDTAMRAAGIPELATYSKEETDRFLSKQYPNIAVTSFLFVFCR